MDLFTYLLLGHLVGDFLFQSSWMAMNKAKQWIPLLIHCIIYTATVSIAILIGGFSLSPFAVGILFFSHVILDKRVFVVWWAKTFMSVTQPTGNWLIIVADQVFHLLILGIIAHTFY
ncbi:DUF3307 domain-containing protein [Sporosarcina sp. PTS2304]|uniref:DUF3307 domain-containing protein n=1 Tax=Sporosarcina sp. PTS2304 TaxID=2283194 RepID=UPI000E0D9D1D|nr:DUF3307 domain-containing protein [Sporosarcina sp. PTS2304]AXH99994.1 DUF3307 domain-containing protein [Sporosarcina sp. PTS2304]